MAETKLPLEWAEDDGVIVLVAAKDADKRPLLYACPKCGAVHSPAIYLASSDVQHSTAREAARECYSCRTHNNCADCGAETHKSRIKCDDCHKKAVLAKATEVQPSEIDHCFGWSEAFYSSVEDAQDAGEPFVFASTFRPFHISEDQVFDWIIEDHYEDASVDDLHHVAELSAAIKAFNEAQTGGTYDEDRTRYAMLAGATP